jgi:hypothetical protein
MVLRTQDKGELLAVIPVMVLLISTLFDRIMLLSI